MEPRSSEQSTAIPPIEMNKLIPSVPFEIYKQSEGINASGLKEILRSPAHYFEHRFNRVDEKETPALLFGKLFHFAVLEPKLFQDNYVVEPIFEGLTLKGEMSTQSKAAKEKRVEWFMGLKKGAIVVPKEFSEKLLRMAQKILSHKIASKILAEGVRETTLWWIDPETGVLCKGRPDFISEKWGLIDLKTTMDARQDAFLRDIRKYDYDLQVGHYCAGARATQVCRSDVFTFIVIEKDPPYEIAVYPAGASILARGERQREKATKLFAECKRTNIWPGYNHEARVIEHPDWLMSNELYED